MECNRTLKKSSIFDEEIKSAVGSIKSQETLQSLRLKAQTSQQVLLMSNTHLWYLETMHRSNDVKSEES